MPLEDETNFATLRDCISVGVIERLGEVSVQEVKKNRSSKRGRSGKVPNAAESAQGDHAFEAGAPAELAEFVDYLAEEAFPALPTDLRELSYQGLQEDRSLADKFSTPVSSDLVDHIANLLPPTIEDSLLAYRLIKPPSSDLCSFLTPILNAYISATNTPPPAPSTTRASACEICDRDWITLTYHHLIPKAVHAKVQKRGWHPDHKLNEVAWLCRACHSFVHRMAGHEELAREWFTVEKILEREDVQRFRQWVGRVRWKKR
jgi:hypothetical protein